MKDKLTNAFIVLLMTTFALFCLSISNVKWEEPKQARGIVQKPILAEIPPEKSVNAEVGENTKIIAPQTGGFWVEL